MTRIKLSFIAFSVLLLLGHSVLPHMHQASDCGRQEVTETRDLSLADIVRATLSANLGLDHLKVYKSHDHPDVIQEFDSECGIFLPVQNILVVFSCTYTETVSIENLNPSARPFLLSRSFRAPPPSA